MERYKEVNGIGYTLVGNYYLPYLPAASGGGKVSK